MSDGEYDCIIIGAGPAGLFCAANLASAAVLVLEKMILPGRKLLLAGSGQCNITHAGDVKSFTSRYGDHGAFLRPALMAFPQEMTREFFASRKVPLAEKESGKIFPASLLADDILDALLAACDEAGVEIACRTPVTSVRFEEGRFHVKTGYGEVAAKTLVIATGGRSYPQTGSSGDGYGFSEMLGHAVVKPEPSLTPVYAATHHLAELSGISISDAVVTLWRDARKILTRSGDLLITRFGYSGPVILDASRWMRTGDLLKIAFTPLAPGELDQRIRDACTAAGTKQIQNLLSGTDCPERLVRCLVATADIPEGTNGAQLSSVMRSRLVKNLTEYPVVIDHPGDFRVAMATAGGVALDQVNKKTCESKILPGLFFVGEVLDIDGDTGGYNLQACFSTAFLAAQGVRRLL